MRTRSQARRRRQPQVQQTSVKSSNLEKLDNPPIVTMADNQYVSQAAAGQFQPSNSGYEPTMVLNHFGPPGFPPFQNPHAISQTISIVGTTSINTEGNNFNQGSDLSTSGRIKSITYPKWCTIQGPKSVNHETEVTKDTMPPANNGSTEDVQPPVVQIQSGNPNPEPKVSPVDTPIPKALISFPSRRNDERRKEKANEQIEKFYEIFKDMNSKLAFGML
ncbi:hypothetical protein Tco_1212040 [Tanacetum coccineum]